MVIKFSEFGLSYFVFLLILAWLSVSYKAVDDEMESDIDYHIDEDDEGRWQEVVEYVVEQDKRQGEEKDGDECLSLIASGSEQFVVDVVFVGLEYGFSFPQSLEYDADDVEAWHDEECVG